jgi:hypothetical protein
MSFTHYIVFGEPKTEMADIDPSKSWGDFKEAIKKHNLELMGPFGPFGVKEESCFILKGEVTDFGKYIGSDAFKKCPIDRTRTVSLYSPDWVNT